MRIQNDGSYELVTRLPRKGKVGTTYWLMRTGYYESYIYENKKWLKIGERTVKDVTTR